LQRFGLVFFGGLLVILVIGFAVTQGIGQPSVPSGDVAIVEGISEGDPSVSEAEYRRAFVQGVAQAVSQGSLKKAPKSGTTRYEELKTAALGGLIDRIWILGEAEELGITATDKQIETELEQIKEQNFPTPKAYAEFLETSQLSQADVDRQVELQVLSKAIQEAINAEAPEPSKDEIADYYEVAKDQQFTTKGTRDVRVVVNKDKAEVDAAKKALEEDSSAANWEDVAAKYSSDPSTNKKGGLQEGISEEIVAAASPQLKKAIFESARNELVGPIQFQGNYTILEVVKLNAEKVQTLEEVESTIANELKQRVQEKFFETFVTDYQSKWESRTFCASGFEIERCSNYVGKPTGSPACYEANPKGGVPAECPAPVTQPSPALPGTVTLLQPNGTRLPQGPVVVAPSASGANEALPEGVQEAPGE
jgi:parvulin-like peptidyl-prolyl isomerase